MKATAERSDVELTGRSLVAGEVRAVLARKKLNSNSLPDIVGRTQTYWYTRLNEKVAFSADDLAALSAGLGVPMSDFVPRVIAPHTPDDNAPVSLSAYRSVRNETPTSTVKAPRFAHVTSLAEYRQRAS